MLVCLVDGLTSLEEAERRGNMKTTVDVAKVNAKWKKDIEFHQGKIREIQNKMSVWQEIVLISSNGTENPTQNTGTPPSAPTMTLPGMIIKILEDSHDWLLTADVIKALEKSGFKSKSGNFRILVASTINKMAKNNRVARKNQGRNVLYASIEFGSNGDNMMFDKQK